MQYPLSPRWFELELAMLSLAELDLLAKSNARVHHPVAVMLPCIALARRHDLPPRRSIARRALVGAISDRRVNGSLNGPLNGYLAFGRIVIGSEGEAHDGPRSVETTEQHLRVADEHEAELVL